MERLGAGRVRLQFASKQLVDVELTAAGLRASELEWTPLVDDVLPAWTRLLQRRHRLEYEFWPAAEGEALFATRQGELHKFDRAAGTLLGSLELSLDGRAEIVHVAGAGADLLVSLSEADALVMLNVRGADLGTTRRQRLEVRPGERFGRIVNEARPDGVPARTIAGHIYLAMLSEAYVRLQRLRVSDGQLDGELVIALPDTRYAEDDDPDSEAVWLTTSPGARWLAVQRDSRTNERIAVVDRAPLRLVRIADAERSKVGFSDDGALMTFTTDCACDSSDYEVEVFELPAAPEPSLRLRHQHYPVFGTKPGFVWAIDSTLTAAQRWDTADLGRAHHYSLKGVIRTERMGFDPQLVEVPLDDAKPPRVEVWSYPLDIQFDEHGLLFVTEWDGRRLTVSEVLEAGGSSVLLDRAVSDLVFAHLDVGSDTLWTVARSGTVEVQRLAL